MRRNIESAVTSQSYLRTGHATLTADYGKCNTSTTSLNWNSTASNSGSPIHLSFRLFIVSVVCDLYGHLPTRGGRPVQYERGGGISTRQLRQIVVLMVRAGMYILEYCAALRFDAKTGNDLPPEHCDLYRHCACLSVVHAFLSPVEQDAPLACVANGAPRQTTF